MSQVLVQRHDGVDRRDVHRQLLGRLACVQRAAEQRLEPTARDDHRVAPPLPPANCSRKRTSLSNSSRMSGIPWRVMAIRSGPLPHAEAGYPPLFPPPISSTAGGDPPGARGSPPPPPLSRRPPPPLSIS